MFIKVLTECRIPISELDSPSTSIITILVHVKQCRLILNLCEGMQITGNHREGNDLKIFIKYIGLHIDILDLTI
jgi:hypothetical protein